MKDKHYNRVMIQGTHVYEHLEAFRGFIDLGEPDTRMACYRAAMDLE
jgi:hypothetical protein